MKVSLGKILDIVSFPLFGFTFVIKLRKLNLESHWKTLICFDKKCVRFEYVSWKNVRFCFIFIGWVHFSHKTENFWFWKSLKCFNMFLTKEDVISDLNTSRGKISEFVSFQLLELTLVIKLRYFDFESHWNTLICCDKKRESDLNIPHGKISYSVPFSLFGFTLVRKLRNFDSESRWNILIIFDRERYGVRFEYVPWENVWFCFI